MSFVAPWLLLALLLVPAAVVLYVWFERRRAQRSQPWATAPLMPAVAPPTGPRWHRNAGPALYLASGAFLVLAIAQPQHDVQKDVEQASVMLVTDRSGSMRAEDLKPNRMAAVRTAAMDFLDAVPDDIRVGAVQFNQKVRLLAGPTTDRDVVRRQIRGLTAAGSTATGDGLRSALQTLRPQGLGGPQTPAAIVLLSDGKNVRGSDPLAAARRAKQLGVRIFTIALGTDTGTLTSTRKDGTTKTEQVPPDREAMAQIASISGGTTSDAPSEEALSEVYRKLGSAVAKEPGKDQLTAIPVGLALIVLAGGVVVSLRTTGRVV